MAPEGIALISAVVAAVANIVVAPVAGRHGTFVVSAALSTAMAVLFILLAPLVLGRWEDALSPSRASFYVILGAAPALAAGTLLYWASVKRLGVSVAYPIASSYPLVVSLFGFLFLGEPFSTGRALGTIAIISGVSLISISSSESRGRSALEPQRTMIPIAFLAMFCWSANTIFVKLAVDDGLGVFTVNLLRMPVIAILLIATLLVRRHRVHTPNLPLRSLLILIVAAVISAAQDLLYFYGLQTSDLSTVVPLASTSPVFVLLLAALFLKERLRLSTSLGTLLTVAGIILVT